MGDWLDRLLDFSHDAGAQLTGGHHRAAGLGQRTKYWLTIVLPDGSQEFEAASYDQCAFALMQQIETDPLDRGEP